MEVLDHRVSREDDTGCSSSSSRSTGGSRPVAFTVVDDTDRDAAAATDDDDDTTEEEEEDETKTHHPRTGPTGDTSEPTTTTTTATIDLSFGLPMEEEEEQEETERVEPLEQEINTHHNHHHNYHNNNHKTLPSVAVRDTMDESIPRGTNPSRNSNNNNNSNCHHNHNSHNHHNHKPHRLTRSVIPFGLCSLALTFSFIASWDCHYFHGASISFTGGSYGLWTLEDSLGNCQLWDVLFFNVALDKRLHAARFFSMTVQVLGLAIFVGLTQALHYQLASWAIGTIWAVAFLLSVLFTTGLYNLWSFFFLFTYIVFILIVRFCFVHPVRRHISPRGLKILAAHCGLCAVASFGTLVVLRTDFCQCSTLSSHALAGRDPGTSCEMNDNDDDDDHKCVLGYAGGLFMVVAALWAATAAMLWTYGIRQPDCAAAEDAGTTATAASFRHNRTSITTNTSQEAPRVLYAQYPRHSITTRVALLASGQLWFLQMSQPPPSQSYDDQEDEDDDNYHRDHENRSDTPHDVERSMASRQTNLAASPTATTLESAATAAASATGESSIALILDTRSCCQKLCCDYRIVERTRREQCFFWSFRLALGVLIFFYLLIVIFMIGTYAENAQAAKSPDTSYNFITDVVCAFNADDPDQPFVTYPSKFEAVLSNMTVAHCGACGDCSNPNDIFTYVKTRRTVAKLAKQCGVMAVLGTPEDLTQCLEKKIGFSRRCTECWSDNMLNTAEYCLFTCLKTTLTGLAATNNVMGIGDTVWLNQCIYCDEKMSGPDFVTCSGVARRRLGIRSEIERDPDEQCRNMDVDWANVNWTHTFPELPA